jgi:hypothetical protein
VRPESAEGAGPALQAFSLDTALAGFQGGWPLDLEQKEYLHGLVAGLIASGRNSAALSMSPPAEPGFNACQRAWVNGLLAGAFSQTSAEPAHAGPAPSPR